MASTNDEERKAYHRQWYAENRERRVAQVSAYREREKEKFRAYKATLTCCACGYCRCARALEFHHVESDQKEANLYDLLRAGVSFRKMQREIVKCVVLCSNCHREFHAGLIELPV